ncbi:MAG TPA: CHAT domain-containing protein [Ktedonobacteraceae bacterium]|jgi:hypothetical protein
MAVDTTIMALLAIWDELPELAGEQWETLGPLLREMLEAYQEAKDQPARDQICLQIQQALEENPQILDRFDDEFVAIQQQSAQTRGPFTFRIPKLFGRLENSGTAGHPKQQKRVFTRYTDISCPNRVWIGTKRIAVVVRLTMTSPGYSEALEQMLLLGDEPVSAHLYAPGFEMLGPFEQTITILPEADSPPVVFDLRPVEVTHTHLVLDFFQAGNPVGTTSIPVEITAEEITTNPQAHAGALLRTVAGVEPPDYMLYISYERSSSSSTLSFELRRVGEVGQAFPPIHLQVPPEKYAAQIYRRLSALTQRIDPTTKAVLGQVRQLDAADAEARLKEEGQNLWRELMPLELRQRYAAERAQWQNRSLLIVSDEPHIPWELLWPYDPDNRWVDPYPLCLQMRVSRWLRREAQGAATYEPGPELSPSMLAVLAPSDTGLLAAQRERAFLAMMIRKHHLYDASPASLSTAAAKSFLQNGGYTWVHFATHGNFYPEDPDGESAIWLEDQQPLTSNSIVGQTEAYLRQARPAFVFNACEVGRQGWTITGLGGWANRLIGAGASLFLAPLWLVNDGAALKFSKTVYRALFEGETVAEAVRQGRLAARRLGDPTWLAYSLYAHPNARIVELASVTQ